MEVDEKNRQYRQKSIIQQVKYPVVFIKIGRYDLAEPEIVYLSFILRVEISISGVLYLVCGSQRKWMGYHFAIL